MPAITGEFIRAMPKDLKEDEIKAESLAIKYYRLDRRRIQLEGQREQIETELRRVNELLAEVSRVLEPRTEQPLPTPGSLPYKA